jgi:Flp pilus assembly protein TadG
MTLRRLYSDDQGGSAVEFGITAPLFFLLIFALIEGGLALWTQMGLQHGVERAARCASVSAATCANADAIANYARSKSFGVNLEAASFTVTTAACGNRVDVNYSYSFLTRFFSLSSLNLTAAACFPK